MNSRNFQFPAAASMNRLIASGDCTSVCRTRRATRENPNTRRSRLPPTALQLVTRWLFRQAASQVSDREKVASWCLQLAGALGRDTARSPSRAEQPPSRKLARQITYPPLRALN